MSTLAEAQHLMQHSSATSSTQARMWREGLCMAQLPGWCVGNYLLFHKEFRFCQFKFSQLWIGWVCSLELGMTWDVHAPHSLAWFEEQLQVNSEDGPLSFSLLLFPPSLNAGEKKKNRESKMMQWLKAENCNTNSVADSVDWFAVLSIRKNAFFYTYVVQGWKMFSVLLSSERWGGSSFPPLVWNQFLLLVSKIMRRTVVLHNWDSQNQLIFWWGLLCKLMATVYSELFAC